MHLFGATVRHGPVDFVYLGLTCSAGAYAPVTPYKQGITEKNKINKKWYYLTSEKGIWKARSQLRTVTADLLWNQHSWKSRLCVLNRPRDPKDPTPPDFPKTPHEFGRTSEPVRTWQGAECLPECSFRPPCQAVSHQQMLGAKGQAPGGLSCSSSMAAAKQCQAISLYRLYYQDWKGSLYV